jgi:hypothetical protein
MKDIIFRKFLESFSSLDDIYGFAEKIGFGGTVLPITLSAEREFAGVKTRINNVAGKLASHIVGRVKSHPSQFFRHLRKDFRYEKVYDLLAFRVLAQQSEDCLDIYGKLREKYPIPKNMFGLWDSNVWNFDVGARNTLEHPIAGDYRSLDFYIYLSDIRVIVEIQTRPHDFEDGNNNNYQVYKRSVLQLVRLKADRDLEKILRVGLDKINEWEKLDVDPDLRLGDILRMYGADYNEKDD